MYRSWSFRTLSNVTLRSSITKFTQHFALKQERYHATLRNDIITPSARDGHFTRGDVPISHLA